MTPDQFHPQLLRSRTSSTSSCRALIGPRAATSYNVVHLLSGVVGLAMAGTAAKARLFAIGYGIVYVLVTILGFIVGDGGSLLSLIPINTADNLLHLAIALTGIGVGLSSPATSVGRVVPQH